MKWMIANANGIIIGILTGIIVSALAYFFKTLSLFGRVEIRHITGRGSS